MVTWVRRWLGYPLVLAVTATLLGGVPAAPAQAEPREPARQAEPVVPGRHAKATPRPPLKAAPPWQAVKPSWPKPGAAAEITLPPPAAREAGGGQTVRVGDLPVWIGRTADKRSPASVRVRQEGRERVALRLHRADGVTAAGPSQVRVDASAFRDAYGGDWFSRLRLWSVTDGCLTGQGRDCRATMLPTRVHEKDGTVTATVTIEGGSAGSLVALAADKESSAGTWSATSLSPSAAWSAGGNTGGFSWNYPLRTPPGLGGPEPKISLSYSSSSVDGRMAQANNQPSWLGEGFDWHPGFIERRYVACADDTGSGANNTAKTGDMCWKTDNAQLSLPGHAGELLKDGSNRWHLRADDGTRIERRTGAENGDNNGEWWLVTTTDGTQYWFGGRADSQATLTVPVFGNHNGEDCYNAASFARSHCVQAYRWQLDHVVDPHGNTMRIGYAKETNRYARNQLLTDAAVYDRAGHPTHIEYGTRLGDSGTAPMRVDFVPGDRCVSNCGSRESWPDLPRDLECAGSPCTFEQTAPSFWTSKRLAAVHTKVWNSGANRYDDVESWTFSHSFLDPSDQVRPVLWLERISHTGKAGGTVSLPDITFVGDAKPNRVDTDSDHYAAMRRFRIEQIVSETGARTNVDYSGADCVAGSKMPDKDRLDENTLRCYPVKWIPPGKTEPITDYFHKYVVLAVHEDEQTGASPRRTTQYTYEGTPEWRYPDEDGLAKPEYKTWSVWRGYGSVLTTVGDEAEKTTTRTRYFRGMHGDKQQSGTATVRLPAIPTQDLPEITDEDEFAGMVRESITYDGRAEVSATAYVPWRSEPTASRTIDGVTVHARHVRVGEEHTRTALDGGRGNRLTKVATSYDQTYGMVEKVDDAGDTGKDDDQTCVLTSYNRNTETGLVDRVARQRTYAVDCATAGRGGLTEAQVIGDVRTSYDQAPEWTDAPAPTRGLVSKVETLKTFDNDDSKSTYVTEQKAAHDAYGRVTEAWDVRGNRNTVAYTPATGGPVTGRTETNALGWTTSATLSPAWGLPVRTQDPNGRVTEARYDGLGRLTHVWLPGRDRTVWNEDASIEHDYTIRNDDQGTVVTTRRVRHDNGYVVSHAFYDGMLRPRQTQSQDGAGGSGAVVTDTYYDSVGRTKRVTNPYPTPAGTGMRDVLYVPSKETLPAATEIRYDGAGRVAKETLRSGVAPGSPGGGLPIHETTYGYGGDRIDTTPPKGGIVTSTISDAAGRTVELRQYQTGHPAGSATGFDAIRYRYNAKGQLTEVTDAANAAWRYEYDLRGRVNKTVDPDLGESTSVFNDAGDLVRQTDNRRQTVGYTYDALGRKKTMRDDSETGTERVLWEYDSLAKGHLTKSTRYVTLDGAKQEYTTQIGAYTTSYQPTDVTYTIPAGEKDLDGSYQFVYTYHDNGQLYTTRIPAAGGLPMEKLTHEYDSFGRPEALETSLGKTYVTDTDYSSYSELALIRLRHNEGNLVDITRTYEVATRRLAQIWTTRQKPNDHIATDVTNLHYRYDQAGNVSSITDQTSNDRQCFRVDHRQQLTDAWTQASGDCVAEPAKATIGGPARYRHSYGYDAAGSRASMTEYGTTAGDRTTTYTIPERTHRVTGTSTVDNTGTRATTLGYDELGNIVSRPAPAGGNQTLTFDRERRLASTSDSAGQTSYVYGADGNRLIRRTPAGKTLYLPGMEIHATPTGGKNATRYYGHAGQTIATRTEAGVSWLAGDHHGTSQATITAVEQTVAIRRQTPFGEQRGGSGAWPARMDKGFVGGTKDPTGLTHLGAREYDPALGRFLSVDPLININDPQQINGYSYANNNPVTLSDPDGLIPRSCPDGVCGDGRGGAHQHRANNPAHTYNPTPGTKRANQPVNRSRANCPDGVGGCMGVKGSVTRTTNLCSIVDCNDRRTQVGIVYEWLGDNVTPDFLGKVREYAAEAGIDPQLLLAILIAESGDCHCARFEKDKWVDKNDDGFWALSVGLGNLQQEAFLRAMEHSGGKIDFGRRDTHSLKDIGNIFRSVQATAHYLRFLSDRADGTRFSGPVNPTVSRNELVRIGYNMGIGDRSSPTGQRDWMTVVGGLDRFPTGDPGQIILDFRERWYVAGNLLNGGG